MATEQLLDQTTRRRLVGVDVGGTFTDFVVVESGQLRIHKVLTTPADQSAAIITGLRELGIDDATIVHGMTVATNALLERRGAKTALLTTAGFADVLHIGRQNRPHLYQLSQQRPPALVPAALRLAVPERLDAMGEPLQPLDEAAVAAIAEELASTEVESLAIVYLFSFLNPAHEVRTAELIQQRLPDLPISLSSAILPEYREFERTATTVMNAYVQPLVSRYLARLETALAAVASDSDPSAHHLEEPDSVPLRIMQSNGGIIGLQQAAHQAARLVLSGPAGGVVGAFALAQQAATANGVTEPQPPQLITFDMGGTSSDVALCPGTIPTTAESTITDLPLRLPVIDIHTVGAGGGSIASVDVGGALRVGPRSAGAVPGPVCYGRGGTEPTVTDANLILGRLDPAGFLGGSGDVHLDVEAARGALHKLGQPLGLSAEATALGVIRVVNASMERALRRVSVERGHDPRQFTLVPFGGAGGLHACELATTLGMDRIFVPPFPGVLSAYGMLVADVAHDSSHSVLRTAAELLDHPHPLRTLFDELVDKSRAVLAREGVDEPTIDATLDLRYQGQSYELTVPLDLEVESAAVCLADPLPLDRAALQAAVAAFHRAHEQRYGYAMRDEVVQVVTLRVKGSSPGNAPPLPVEADAGADATAARLPDRAIWFDAVEATTTACYAREALRAGNQITGPALVMQYDSTVLLPADWQGEIDGQRNLWLTRTAGR